jgi:hypothetical protein
LKAYAFTISQTDPIVIDVYLDRIAHVSCPYHEMALSDLRCNPMLDRVFDQWLKDQ